MKDARIDQELSAYFDGELDADARARVEARLAASAELRGQLERLRTLEHSLAELPATAPSPGFGAAVRSRIDREARPQREPLSEREPVSERLRAWLSRWRLGTALGGLAIATAALLLLLRAPGPPSVEPEKTLATATSKPSAPVDVAIVSDSEEYELLAATELELLELLELLEEWNEPGQS